MKRTWLILATLVTAAALLLPVQAVQPVLAAPAQAGVPRYEKGPCTVKIPAGVQEGTDLECGKLIVPELYEAPEGPTISLAVVIIKAKETPKQPDPVVFAQGGPGASTIDYFIQVLPSGRLRTNRDLVLFDQRGTLNSKPNLFCQEIFDETIATLPLNLKAAEAEQRYNAAAMQCHDRLAKQGVNLQAYNSVENASDIESLRIALGYDQINLYGVSYGTLLALHTMHQYPDALRSVIIDSVVPMDKNFNYDAPNSEDRAFTELFKACQEDAKCSAAYPNLEKTFFDLVARLNKKPVTIKLTDAEDGKVYDALINGDTLISSFFQMLYITEIIPFLPKTIEDISLGHYSFLERILSQTALDRTTSYGMYFSTTCAEVGDVDPAQFTYQNIRPEIAKDQAIYNAGNAALCKAWNVPVLDPAQEKPVVSDIPTLIFNGRFDPITPPAYGQEVADTLSHSYYFVFPNTGHGAISSTACADRIFLEFLNDPQTKPDGSCIAQIPAVTFITNRDVVNLPRMTHLLNLEGTSAVELGLLGFCLLILLTGVVIFPLLWLIRVVRSKPGKPTPFLAHLAPWTAAIDAGLILIFVIGLIAVIFVMVSKEDMRYLFGIPSNAAPILVAPPLAALVTLVMCAFSITGWAGSYWSIGRKIYYSLVTLAGIGCVAVLGYWGMLTALIR
jgi:pimeloyl-ACP methyl ester carboxylesterase